MSAFTRVLGIPFRLVWSPICLLYYIPIVFFAKIGDSTRKNGWLMLLGILLFLWPVFLVLAIIKSIEMTITYVFSNTSKEDYVGEIPSKTYTYSNTKPSYTARDIADNCYKCYGNGIVACNHCSGKGRLQVNFSTTYKTCSVCGGSGTKICKH
jgi:hypothetical protein